MKLPPSKAREKYIEEIQVVESFLHDATSPKVNDELLSKVQKQLDALAEKWQKDEAI